MSKVALITGITGQDGSYLADFLLKKGYEVDEIKRRTSLFIMESRDLEATYAANDKEIRNTHINIGIGVDISIRKLALRRL